MQTKKTGPMTADNPFFGAAMKSRWAHLSRIGGDRVAILFQELRRKAGAIEGLTEELTFAGEKEGWVPTYLVEGRPLFTAQIGAGSLEVAMCLDASERERLIASGKVNSAMKRALDEARNEGAEFLFRIALKNRRDVAAAAKLIALRSRTVSK